MTDRLFTINSSGIPEVVSGATTSDDITVKFSPGLELSEKYLWEVGLIRVDTWNSVHNIKAVYNNNTLRYSPDGGATWKTLVMPDGSYEIADLETALQNFMQDNGDYDNTNPAEPHFYIAYQPIIAEGKLRIELSNNYQIDLSIGDYHKIIGFTSTILTATGTGYGIIDITRGVDSWSIHCSIAGGSYDNNVGSDIVYGFTPTAAPGYAVQEVPSVPVFLPLAAVYQPGTKITINNIRMRLTDQLNRPILLNGEDVIYRLVVRAMAAKDKVL